MSHVLDLEGGDEADLLAATEADGLLGPDYLCSAPLATRLADGETARYLVRNKKAGTTIQEADDRERRLAPDDDYQAFALVTDRRLLFVAGGADGDETFSLPLAEVLEADAESAGLRTSRLAIETVDGRRITFPSRGSLEDVAATIDDDAAAWSHAERRREDAEESIADAREALADGDPGSALAALEAARTAWDEAVEALEAVHEDAKAWMTARVEEPRSAEVALRRRATGRAGASGHADAQAAWEAGDYERAADCYERAVEGYRDALEIPGDEPSEASLRQRIDAAVRERSILRVAPVADAHAARERAANTDDVEAVAEAWEHALERYRAVLEFEWGEAGREFAIDREAIREQTAAAAESAIDARRDVADRWLTAGDALAATQDDGDAGRLYDRAERHLEAARALAEEVQPERLEGIEESLSGIEGRRSGRIEPPSEPPDGPMPVDSVAEALAVLGDDVDLGGGSAETDRSEERADPPTPGAGGAGAVSSAGGTPSLDDAAGEPASAAESEDSVDRAALLEGLRDLDEGTFTDLVAAVWTARGWATTAFETAAGTIYDLLAVRDDERLLLWTVHEPDGGAVDLALVERCGATLERSRGADRAVIVTNGTAQTAATERATDTDVEVVDGDALAAMLEETGLADRLA